MVAVDVSGISYFAPILAFLIVFVIIFAVLNKTKIFGEVNNWVLLFVSFLVATVFVSAAGVRDYVLTITPWFAALIVSLFFLLFILAFVGKPLDDWNKGIGILFIIVLIIVFLISGFVVFSDFLMPYLSGEGSEGSLGWLFNQSIYNSRVFGALLLIAISAVVSWVLMRKGGK